MRLKLIVLLFACMSCYAQNLTVDEMLRIKTEDIAGIEEYLSGKGWILLSSEEETPDAPGRVNFAYNKGKDNDSAESFLKCLYSKETGMKVLNLQLHSQEKYNNYLTAIKAVGNNLVYSKIGTDKVTKVYQSATTTFLIKVKTKKDKDGASTANIYHIFIMSNVDYKLNNRTEMEVLPQVVDVSVKK
jgi:hypothetical protein